MPKKTVRQFINQATKMLHDQNYNERCIKYDVGVWREFLKFCDKKKHKIYSRSHNEEFITELRNHMPQRITPHMMRHTKAMHIYEAENNLIYVRDFLGHSDIKTTDIYARSSLSMKRMALEKVTDSPIPKMPSWQQSKDMMEWLKTFGTKKQ